MTEGSKYALETLRTGGEFTLYRGRQPGNPTSVLLLALPAEQPSSQNLVRLQHEYSLAAELDPAWTARPLALTRSDGRTMLVLEDAGGEPLDRILARRQGRPLELTRCLRVAIGVATALAHVHRRGLIHKDIKPAHVLVDADDRVQLTGFGIASRLPRERQVPAPPEIIAGTLAYMAPEQTGRMNRSIDARSDLYSVGVTMYEMLTGTLPFAATDPLEWVHCHVAREPTPPWERAAVPTPLGMLTLKLLAKNAEERYQTASGLEGDLRRCLTDWESHGRIDPFPLGAHDASDRLIIPEKLYGRESEIATLLASFDRVVAHGTPELVLVSGYSGIGKSSVVNELHKSLVPPRGLFAAGKFDQYKRDIPYATLAHAFQSLVRPLLGQSEAELGRWREALRDALGQNGQLIVNLVPELELVIGTQPPVADLAPQDVKNRFQLVFRQFVAVFARREHPLALFLDDLQWLDAATLDLLESLVTHGDVHHLLLIGAYRDNEVGPAHPLLRTIETLRKSARRVEQIILTPLRPDDVGRLVADALHCEPERALPLAQLVHAKTGGAIRSSRLNSSTRVAPTTGCSRSRLNAGPTWQWDIDRIHRQELHRQRGELMARKLKRLPASTQDALKLAPASATLRSSPPHPAPTGQQRRTDARDTLGSRARRAHLSASRAPHLPARPDTTSGVFADSRRAACRRSPAHRPRAAGEHDARTQLAEHLFDVANQFNRGAARLIDRTRKCRWRR